MSAKRKGAEPSAALRRGVVYVARGAKYLQEAQRSLGTVRESMPQIQTAIFTDQPDAEGFDFIEPLGAPGRFYQDKIEGILRSPFAQTLYLDTDTLVCADCTELFDLVEQFDIAGAAEPSRNHLMMDCVPDWFPEWNTGVLVYRNSDAVRSFLCEWETMYARQLEIVPGAWNDQLPFRISLFQSSLRIHTLPPEYNFRTEYAAHLCAWAKVKILHGRHRNPDAVLELLNRSHKPRVFLPRLSYMEARYFTVLTPELQQDLPWVLRAAKPVAYAASRVRGVAREITKTQPDSADFKRARELQRSHV